VANKPETTNHHEQVKLAHDSYGKQMISCMLGHTWKPCQINLKTPDYHDPGDNENV